MTDYKYLKTESKDQITAITDAAQTVEGHIYFLMDEIEQRDLEIEKLKQMNESLHDRINDLDAEIEMLEASNDN